MEYVCKFADERGQVQENVEQAVSETDVRERYAKQGLMVYSVRTRGGLSRLLTGSVNVGGKKLKLEQFLIFNQQFVTLIRAGLPILKGLEIGRKAGTERTE